MSAQVHSVPGQLKGEGLSPKLFLTCEGNVNYYKSAHHPVPILPVGKGSTHANSKQISKISFQLNVEVCSLLGQSEGERKAFFEGCKKKGHIMRLPTRALGCSE